MESPHCFVATLHDFPFCSSVHHNLQILHHKLFLQER